MLLEKVRAELDDYLFPYQKVGLNMGIDEYNKALGVQLDYICNLICLWKGEYCCTYMAVPAGFMESISR